jgi:hypothetical protein
MRDELTDDLLRVRVRCLLILGRLPVENAIGRRVAPGRGATCAACDRKIEREDVEVVLHFPSPSPQHRTTPLHSACEWMWNAERTREDVLAELQRCGRPRADGFLGEMPAQGRLMPSGQSDPGEPRRTRYTCPLCAQPVLEGELVYFEHGEVCHATGGCAGAGVTHLIETLLRNAPGHRMCHDCLARCLETPYPEVRKATTALRVEAGFVVELGARCSSCRRARVAISFCGPRA